MSIVSLIKCENYDYQQVEKAMFSCLDDIFFSVEDKFYSGAKVLLKINLLKKNRPEDAVTTHPSVVKAVAKYLIAKNCKVVIGDSPAGPFSKRSLEAIYKASGMIQVAEETGAELNYDISVVNVVNSKAKLLKNMQVIKVIQDVDLIISLAKLKTHAMMTLTASVKNLFGVIPGLIKAEYHFKLHDEMNFANHLIDICEYVNPVISIIDGIEGMEGNGPSGGEKRKSGVLMASVNPYALDTLAAHFIGMKPTDVPTIRAAKERKLFSGDIDDVDVVGEALEAVKIKPFKLPDSAEVTFIKGKVPKFIEDFFINTLKAKPVFDFEKCIGCKDCKIICPPQIIEMNEMNKPVPDYRKCISCFCCHEVCPKQAIEIKKHWLHKIIFK